jgi:hypothetical protein
VHIVGYVVLFLYTHGGIFVWLGLFIGDLFEYFMFGVRDIPSIFSFGK